MAVAALDELVTELVEANPLHVSPKFFDWVADDATPALESQVRKSLSQPRFMASLEMGDPRTALATWVRHWTIPLVQQNFQQLVCIPRAAMREQHRQLYRIAPAMAVSQSFHAAALR